MVIFRRLPDHVSALILLRLPVKSLCRFKCVAKSWNSFIADQRFIARHAAFEGRNRDFLLVSSLDHFVHNQVLSFISNDTFKCVGQDLIHPLNRIQGTDRLSLQILGPCEGVFCLFDGKQTIALWNPAIKELRVLPPSNIAFPPHSTALETCIGFGFDPNSEDFKVLAFRHMCAPSYAAMAHAELYTLSLGKWKPVEVGDEFHPIGNLPSSFSNPSINGIFSWFEMDDHAQKVVFSFDMSNEVFLKTRLPDYGIPSKRLHGCLLSYNNSLAFVHDYPCLQLQGLDKCFDVWLLGEYGVRKSWEKLLTIGPISGIERPLCFVKSGPLILESSLGELVCCNPFSRGRKQLEIRGTRNTLRVFTYRESLVSVKTRRFESGGKDSACDEIKFPTLPLFSV